MSLKTVAFTILLLTGMEAVLSSKAASGRVGSAMSLLSSGIQYLVSPAYPLIPDLRIPASQRPHVPQDTSPDQTFAPGGRQSFPFLSTIPEGI